MANRECRIQLSESEWEELSTLATRRTADRGQVVTVEEIVHAAVQEYIYRIEIQRKGSG